MVLGRKRLKGIGKVTKTENVLMMQNPAPPTVFISS